MGHCGIEFCVFSSLRQHQREQHIGQKINIDFHEGFDPPRPFNCNKCDLKFVRNTDLSRHVRSVHREKMHKCRKWRNSLKSGCSLKLWLVCMVWIDVWRWRQLNWTFDNSLIKLDENKFLFKPVVWKLYTFCCLLDLLFTLAWHKRKYCQTRFKFLPYFLWRCWSN